MESGTCAAPDGHSRALSLSPRTATIIVSIVGFLPILLYLFVPRLIFSIGGRLGRHLRAKSAGRRNQILQEQVLDEKKWWNTLKTTGEGSTEDWARFEAETQAMFSEEKGPDFRGVIGFLHPFWYLNNIEAYWDCADYV